MKRTKRTLAVAVFTLVSCSTQVLPATTPTVPTAPLRLYATTAAAPLLQDLLTHFAESMPDIRFETLTGSYETMMDTLLDTPDAYLLTNYLPPESDLWAAPIAQDGIAIIAHPDTGLTGLTTDQLRQIYQGHIANWRDLGGADQELIVISREDESGTRAVFDRLVMGERQTTLSAQVAPSSAAMLASVARQPGSIGYVSMSYLDENVQALTIDGIAVNLETVLDNTYPLRSTIYLVGTAEPQDAAYRNFIAWAQSLEGQIVVEEHYAPLLRLDGD